MHVRPLADAEADDAIGLLLLHGARAASRDFRAMPAARRGPAGKRLFSCSFAGHDAAISCPRQQSLPSPALMGYLRDSTPAIRAYYFCVEAPKGIGRAADSGVKAANACAPNYADAQ